MTSKHPLLSSNDYFNGLNVHRCNDWQAPLQAICIIKYSTTEEIEKLLHVAFNSQTVQEVEEAIDALGLESIPFPEIHARKGKKHKSTIVKKASPHGNEFEGICPIASTAQALHYVGRIKKGRKMSCPLNKDRVLQYMSTMAKSRQRFFATHNDITVASDTEI